jgi:ATP-dependent helicase/nuclease subunit B
MAEPFLSELAKDLHRRYPDNLKELCIVFQSRRAKTFFKHYLAEQTRQTVWMPEIFTIEEFVQQLSTLRIIDPIDLLFEFYQVYQKTGGTDSFDQFIQWGQTLIEDFSDIDHYRIPADALFNHLTDVKAIEQWDPADSVLTDFQVRYLTFWRSFGPLYAKFREHLVSQRKGYQGLVFREVAENIEAHVAGPRWTKIVFAGFNALSKAEETILNALIESDRAEVFWDSDIYYLHNASQEAGRFLRRYFKQWRRNEWKWERDFLGSDEKSIHIIGVSRAAGQAKVAGDLLTSLSMDNPDLNRTAIVLADENLLFPVLHSIPEHVKAINASMGLPLKQTPLFDLVEAFFDLYENADRLRRPEDLLRHRFYFSDVLKILNHPFIKFLDPAGTSRILMEAIRVHNILFLSPDDIRHHGKEMNFALSSRLFDYWKDTHDAHHFLRELTHEILNGLAEKKTHTPEREAVFAFSKILNRAESLLRTYHLDIDRKTFRHLLREWMSMTRLPFTGEPLQGVQIMGMLETRSIDFDSILLLSVNENILPAAKSQNSLIPHDMRRQFGLPTHSEKDAIFAYNFYRLLQRAKNIFLIYNTETDVFGKGERSRFIAQLLYELPRVNKKVKIQESYFSLPVIRDAANPKFGEITIQKVDAVQQKINALLQSGISPSKLNSYIKCSLHFYLKYIAGITERDEIEETVKPMTFGTVIHKALESLFRPYEGTEIRAEIIDGMIPKIAAVVRESFGSVNKSGEVDYGKNHLLYRVSIKLVETFLNQQKNSMPKAGRTVLLVEKELRAEMVMDYKGVPTPIALKGKIDRVDQTRDAFTVIDYKSGTVEASELKPPELSQIMSNPKFAKSLQLLCYGYLFRKNFDTHSLPIKAGIYAFRNLTDGLKTITMKDVEHGILREEFLVNFENAFKALILPLLDPEQKFTQTENLDHCRRCEFNALCRREPSNEKF